jgi:hypothetical protein
MLSFVGNRLSIRKEMLFVVACCRKIWNPIEAEVQAALNTLERYADGEASKEEAERAAAGTDAALGWLVRRPPGLASDYAQDWAVGAGERESTVALIRDLFNPFQPLTLYPTWLTWNDGTVPKIAQGVYDEGALDRMPVLADALEEAGCADQSLLSHCRQPGPHVRGCWLVDCLLGKR